MGNFTHMWLNEKWVKSQSEKCQSAIDSALHVAGMARGGMLR